MADLDLHASWDFCNKIASHLSHWNCQNFKVYCVNTLLYCCHFRCNMLSWVRIPLKNYITWKKHANNDSINILIEYQHKNYNNIFRTSFFTILRAILPWPTLITAMLLKTEVIFCARQGFVKYTNIRQCGADPSQFGSLEEVRAPPVPSLTSLIQIVT